MRFEKHTEERFISRVKEKHGDLYDYSKVIYTGALQKVEIICKKHGPFWQQANSHLRGAKCPSCTGRFMNTELFKEKAVAKHGDKYDYSKTTYKGVREPVDIICKIHGVFSQNPSDHIKGRGCQACAIISSSLKQSLTKEQFIERAKQVHGNLYDYSLIEYKGYKEHINLTCSVHGNFSQAVNVHLKGGKCTQCSKSSGFNRTRFVDLVSRHGEGYLYLVHLYNEEESFYKLGITCRDIRLRMNCLPFDKEIIHVEKFYDGGVLFDAENKLHAEFRNYKYVPLKSFGGDKECYLYIDTDIFNDVLHLFKQKDLK